MTLTLLLIRHAKSDWGSRSLSDHERPLNDRGRRDAARMGRWIADHGVTPREVLCSNATRTRETLDLMLPAWSPPPHLSYRRDLYHAAPEAMLAALGKAEADCVALVAHNPGIGLLAGKLARKEPGHARWEDYPTCAVAVLTFDARHWADLRNGTGDVLAFAIPADLG
jgi:phosphohistidine phosphatase